MKTLQQCDHRLREAVIRASFEEVSVAAGEYRQAFDRAWSAMAPAERRRSAMPLEAARLIRWALQHMTISRAELADLRRATGAAGRYLATGRNRRMRTWGSAG